MGRGYRLAFVKIHTCVYIYIWKHLYHTEMSIEVKKEVHKKKKKLLRWVESCPSFLSST